MNSRSKKTKVSTSQALHHYYTSILDCMPHLVYWLDKHGIVQGCNQNMKRLLNIKNINQCAVNFYQKLTKALELSPEDTDRLIAEDKNEVSVEQKRPQYLRPQSHKTHIASDYLCNRELLRDTTGRMIGLIIFLKDRDK